MNGGKGGVVVKALGYGIVWIGSTSVTHCLWAKP